MENTGADASYQSSQGGANAIYLKALPIRKRSDIYTIKDELEKGNIIIARITPIARESVDEAKDAVNELCSLVKDLGGDIARLGEERLVITPSSIKIWRKSSASSD